MQGVRRSLAEVESAPPEGPQPTRWSANTTKEWGRETDGTVAKIVFKTGIYKTAVADMADNRWLLHANVAREHWRTDGPEIGKRFVVQFLAEGGANGLARRRASAAL